MKAGNETKIGTERSRVVNLVGPARPAQPRPGLSVKQSKLGWAHWLKCAPIEPFCKSWPRSIRLSSSVTLTQPNPNQLLKKIFISLSSTYTTPNLLKLYFHQWPQLNPNIYFHFHIFLININFIILFKYIKKLI